METENEKKYDNKYLLERQLEMIKIFYERKLLSKEQYEFEVQTLTTRIKTDHNYGEKTNDQMDDKNKERLI